MQRRAHMLRRLLALGGEALRDASVYAAKELITWAPCDKTLLLQPTSTFLPFLLTTGHQVIRLQGKRNPAEPSAPKNRHKRED